MRRTSNIERATSNDHVIFHEAVGILAIALLTTYLHFDVERWTLDVRS